MKEKIEKMNAILENQQACSKLIHEKLESSKKNYTISSINMFDGLINLMSMCLITDYFISICKPDSKEIKYLNQLRKKKDILLKRIREQQSLLTIKGKLKQYSKFEFLKIMVIKITFHILTLFNQQKLSTTQEQLYKRLNFLICGVNISSKCYKLSLNKVNKIHKNVEVLKEKEKQEQEQNKRSSKQNSQFKKIFGLLETNENRNQQNGKKNYNLNDGNKKIHNILQKVRNTINGEMKRLNSMRSNKQNEEKKSNESSELQEKEVVQSRRVSISIQNKITQSRAKKRVGTINGKQNIDSRFKKFSDCIGQQNSKSDQSFQSAPQTDQNWYKPQGLMKVKKVYILSLPGMNAKQR